MSSNPTIRDLQIPRFEFEFNADGIGHQTEFSLTIPASDVRQSAQLKPKLEFLPKCKENSMEAAILNAATNTEGGSLNTQYVGDSLQVQFGFTPLPQRATVPNSVKGFRERMNRAMEPLIPYLIGRMAVYNALAKITAMQYQFGVAPSVDSLPDRRPARLSFADGNIIEEPRVVVTHDFDNTRQALISVEAISLTSDIAAYLRFLDPQTLNGKSDAQILSNVSVNNYNRIFGNGHSSYGQRTADLTEDELHSKETATDVKLQFGDKYVAQGHNLDEIRDAREIALVAVGSINKRLLSNQS